MAVEKVTTLGLHPLQSPSASLESYALVVVLVLLAVILFGIGLGQLWRDKRTRDTSPWSGADEEATEIAGAKERSLPAAHLVAKEKYQRLPLQIDLYYNREVSMGRNSRVCNVLLDDIGVSRRHATIFYRNGRFYLRDDGSKGGTYLHKAQTGSTGHEGNARKKPRLARLEERVLHEGDEIQIYAFYYYFRQENQPTEAPDDNDTQTPD